MRRFILSGDELGEKLTKHSPFSRVKFWHEPPKQHDCVKILR
jgi:hypothetical protein